MSEHLRVFIGYDPREDEAYRVCAHSLRRNSESEIEIHPLIQSQLRDRGLYTRPMDPLSSTEFTFTRFLVPYLTDYEGWALFCDCDFLWLGDVANLFAKADPRYAVMCVHHEHVPAESLKMDGRVQTRYPRKNWSSLVLWNCGHEMNRALTPAAVSSHGGEHLHRFLWIPDDKIGEIPELWNWLEGVSPTTDSGRAVADSFKQGGPVPDAVHFTRGGPWFEKWKDVEYAELWRAARDEMRAEQLV